MNVMINIPKIIFICKVSIRIRIKFGRDVA